MTYSFKSDDTDRTFSFSSEDAFDTANEWYNKTDKGQIAEFCREHGVELIEPTDDPYFRTGTKLVDDWAYIAMEVYAKVNAQ